LVTRAAHQAGKLSEALRGAGFEPVEVPVLEIRPPDDLGPLDSSLQKLDTYDWLILTSGNAVRALVERAEVLGVGLGGVRTAAVGEATAGAARGAGLSVDVVPEKYVAEALVACLAGQVAGKRVLLARAEVARDVIPDALRAAGATVDVVDAYRNVLPSGAAELLRAALEQGGDKRIWAATFTSSSSVTHLKEAARVAGVVFPFAGVRAISIGPITSTTLREVGWEPAAEASVSDIAGLVAAVGRVLG
jgi:uroporphyrinogen-III synthase/uroporphyrinogen III methyltransferase/synthase